MAQRRHHYERAFETLLRERRIPYVSVDEARKTLVPPSGAVAEAGALKSFDFVVSSPRGNLLVDVKGRRCSGRLESWVTLEDVESLARWEALFGPAFSGAFVFLYWCDSQPPDALFQEVFEAHGRWYAVRTVVLEPYRRSMRMRSRKWGTVDLPAAEFERLSEPFLSRSLAAAG